MIIYREFAVEFCIMRITKDIEVDSQNIITNSTFFLIRVQGNSMINANISTGDYLLVEKNYSDLRNAIVVAELNGAWTVKIFSINKKGNIELIPANDEYNAIEVTEEDNFRIIGKVVKVIKSFN